MLGNCLLTNKVREESESEDGVKDLVDITLRKMDHDKDGRISVEDFQKSVDKDFLMLEAFGTCLPSNESGQRFKNSILDH